MHIIEKKTIPEFSEEYNLTEVKVLGIYTAVRKREQQPLECR